MLVVFQNIWKTNRRRRFFITSTTTMQYLWNPQKKVHFWAFKSSIWWVICLIVLIRHENFFLFRFANNKLRDQRFSTSEEVVVTFMFWKYLNQKYFDNWFESMQKSIDLHGDILKNNNPEILTASSYCLVMYSTDS